MKCLIKILCNKVALYKMMKIYGNMIMSLYLRLTMQKTNHHGKLRLTNILKINHNLLWKNWLEWHPTSKIKWRLFNRWVSCKLKVKYSWKARLPKIGNKEVSYKCNMVLLIKFFWEKKIVQILRINTKRHRPARFSKN